MVQEPVPSNAGSELLAQQPIVEVERDGVHYTLLGTAHVSRASVDAVDELLRERDFDAVAVELCESRFSAVQDPERLQQLDLFRALRDGKAGFIAANLALSAYQRRIAEQFGIEPGAEMKAAIDGAQVRNQSLWRIDRDVGLTLRRAYRAVGFWDRMGIVGGLMTSLVVSDKVSEEDIEKLKQGDMLESTFNEFARQSQPLYHALIAERDAYMAASLREHAAREPDTRRVLAVVGAGHLQGLEQALRSETRAPTEITRELVTVKPSIWPRLMPWILLVFVLGGFALGYMKGADIGTDLVVLWVVMTGSLAAVGALIAGAHPLSALSGLFAAPITALHPALAAGMVTAGVELWLRKPTVADFGALREDLRRWRGWWHNRVARTLLVFIFTNFGTMAGVYIAGFKIFTTLL